MGAQFEIYNPSVHVGKDEDLASVYGSVIANHWPGLDFSSENKGETLQKFMLLSAAVAEYKHRMIGRPYFKVYPEYVGPLADTSLDVPAEYCRYPYDVFEIRLPVGHGLNYYPLRLRHDWTPDDEQITNLLVFEEQQTWASACDLVRRHHPEYVDRSPIYDGIVMTDVMYALRDAARKNLGKTPDQTLCVSMLSHAATRDDRLSTRFAIHLFNDMTVEEAIELQMQDYCKHLEASAEKRAELGLGDDFEERLRLQGESLSRIVSLVMSITFLATNQDRIIEPDVLNKDLQKFIHADDEEVVKKLHLRATRRRNEGEGFTVGRRERLLQLAQARQAGLTEAGEGRELKHQHQRRGHIHKFHTKEGPVYKWIPQLTVRPDLPVSHTTSSGLVIR